MLQYAIVAVYETVDTNRFLMFRKIVPVHPFFATLPNLLDAALVAAGARTEQFDASVLVAGAELMMVPERRR